MEKDLTGSFDATGRLMTLYKGIVDEVQQRTAKAITAALSKPTTNTGEPHA